MFGRTEQRMMETLKKIGRMLRRDRFATVGVGIAMIPIAAVTLVGASAPTAMVAAGWVAAGIIAGAFTYAQMKREGAEKDVDMGFRKQGGIASFQHLRGPKRKVAVIVNTQKLLSRLMRKHQHAATLPADALQKFS